VKKQCKKKKKVSENYFLYFAGGLHLRKASNKSVQIHGSLKGKKKKRTAEDRREKKTRKNTVQEQKFPGPTHKFPKYAVSQVAEQKKISPPARALKLPSSTVLFLFWLPHSYRILGIIATPEESRRPMPGCALSTPASPVEPHAYDPPL
jgi:hypothetical protein